MAWKRKDDVKPDLSMIDKEKWRARVAYWREYSDKFLDEFESTEADFTLNILQRIYMRVSARYKNSFITATRGSTKSYISQGTELAECDLFPGKWISMVAPSKEQSRNIAKETNDQFIKNYPMFSKEFKITKDTADEFVLSFPCGSKYRTAAVQNSSRGGNDHDISVEEVGQTGGGAVFNEQIYLSAFLPRVRKKRFVKGRRDLNERVQRKSYITSASSKQTYAYRVMRNFTKKMMRGDKDYYSIGNSWEVTVMLGLKTIQEIAEYAADASQLDFMREFGSVWTGTTTDSLVSDEILSRSRKIQIAEFRHCGDPKVRYVVGYDVAREEGQQNAESAIVVVKETPMSSKENASPTEKYWKDVVYIESFEGAEHTAQAKHVKQIYANFCPPQDDNDYEDTIFVVDANGYGMALRDELMKNLHDGIPPFAPKNDDRLEAQVQPGAARIMYCMKADTATDPESEMVIYYESEFEHGRVRLLVDSKEGLEKFKKKHKIHNDDSDYKYVVPYQNTQKLTDQISNLKQKGEGTNKRETRIHKSIPRDIHSALKYCLRMSQLRELENGKIDKEEDEWEKEFKKSNQHGRNAKCALPFKNRGRVF
ncbi:MAG: hypothetical protein AB9836_04535 [Aminipila sp.]